MIKKIITMSLIAYATSSFAIKTPPLLTPILMKDVVLAAASNPFGNFLNYRVEGVCFWVRWTMFGPVYSTTLKVNEFLPDAVVSVYDHDDENPWDYGMTVLDPVFKKAGQTEIKTTLHQDMTQSDQSMSPMGAGSGFDAGNKFKDVDIIGDPAVHLVNQFANAAMIPTQAVPFHIYYSSLLDAYLWRTPQLEMLRYPYYLPPRVRDVTQNYIETWGAIFPRVGFVSQPDDYKAAAVLALRAADIATNPGQMHVYNVLGSTSCGQHCRVWPSRENDFSNVKYQEIYPVAQTTAVNEFGKSDLTDAKPYGQDQYDKGKGSYVWVMWRHYEGCIQGSGNWIGET